MQAFHTGFGEPSAWAEMLDRLTAMGRGFIAALPSIAVAFVAFAMAYVVGRMIRSLVERTTRKRRKHRNIARVLGRVVQGGFFILGVLIAAVIVFPNFTPASLIQLLGISGVAIGFAFRDILQNYLGGILLLLTEPFRIGDQIKFGAFEGTVEDIQTRATFIRTYDDRRVVIPNGELFTSSVEVNTAYEQRRLEYDVGIGYGDDLAAARRLIHEALAELEGVLQRPAPEVLVFELAASSVVLRVRWWVRPPRKQDALISRDQVLAAIKDKLTSNGIDLPFPTQHVLFHDQTEETDGDRNRQREGWPAGPNDTPAPQTIARSMLQRHRSEAPDHGPPTRADRIRPAHR